MLRPGAAHGVFAWHIRQLGNVFTVRTGPVQFSQQRDAVLVLCRQYLCQRHWLCELHILPEWHIQRARMGKLLKHAMRSRCVSLPPLCLSTRETHRRLR